MSGMAMRVIDPSMVAISTPRVTLERATHLYRSSRERSAVAAPPLRNIARA